MFGQIRAVRAWLDRGGAEGDLMELNGWTSPQMLCRYGARPAAPGTPDLQPHHGRRVMTRAITA